MHIYQLLIEIHLFSCHSAQMDTVSIDFTYLLAGNDLTRVAAPLTGLISVLMRS